jgi:peroxiredoxin
MEPEMPQSIANRKGEESPQRSLIEVQMGAYGGEKKSHEKTTIRPGAAFPSVGMFRSTSGRMIDLEEKEREQHVVLFFYPGDLEGLRYPEIAGCTPEACMFRDNVSVLRDLGATVYGVNLHPSKRQKSLVAREHLNFELLSNFERKLVDALGVPTWSTEYGEIFVVRTTVIVRKGG